ncbi:DUF2490 domain-containing protein [Methylocaldum sp.]|uniref:DUF2490 domain-containing protein n=1 Tax=Methylocaldum sp. TaxID=1969727 RepID=UPI002D5EBFB2|nr:DUF2490 domain-containing protein [Methylocaldum sp.]HYE36706.1 DUF2490 domain-containing protein [Methylocaldum sp.]
MKDRWNQRLVWLLSAIVLGAPHPTTADTVEDFQTWGNITAVGGFGFIDPKFQSIRYWLEGQGRFGEDTSRLSQSMMRPALGYALNDRASVWLGYAWIFTDRPFARRRFDENRIWQQFLWTQSTALGSFSSRSRLEQRFAETGDDVGWRFRQFVKLSVPLAFARDFSLVGWEEVFVNISKADWGADDGLDQNRVFVGLGYNFDKHIKTEIGYMNQYIRRAEAPDRISHVLSASLLLNY